MRSTRIKFQRQIWNGKECDRHEEEKDKKSADQTHTEGTAGDWRKYLLVSLFLILTIGFVSGMYVANESMMKAADEGVTKYKLEDGHFELNEEADQTLLAAIATGEKADVKQYYTDKARRELDEKFDDEFEDKFKDEFDSQFKEEFDRKFNAEFQTQFDQTFAAQVKQTLLAQGMDETMAAAMLDTAVAQAKPGGKLSAGLRCRLRERVSESLRYRL